MLKRCVTYCFLAQTTYIHVIIVAPTVCIQHLAGSKLKFEDIAIAARRELNPSILGHAIISRSVPLVGWVLRKLYWQHICVSIGVRLTMTEKRNRYIYIYLEVLIPLLAL